MTYVLARALPNRNELASQVRADTHESGTGERGTAYRTPRNPSHASQPHSPSTKKRRMIRKKLDG
jgi:hypothetical protein